MKEGQCNNIASRSLGEQWPGQRSSMTDRPLDGKLMGNYKTMQRLIRPDSVINFYIIDRETVSSEGSTQVWLILPPKWKFNPIKPLDLVASFKEIWKTGTYVQ